MKQFTMQALQLLNNKSGDFVRDDVSERQCEKKKKEDERENGGDKPKKVGYRYYDVNNHRCDDFVDGVKPKQWKSRHREVKHIQEIK